MKEIYKPILFNPNYSISNFGNVKNNKTGRILKSCINNKGYCVLGLSKNNNNRSITIHTLVYKYFKDFFNNKIIIHIDKNRNNNNINNLIERQKFKYKINDKKKFINNSLKLNFD